MSIPGDCLLLASHGAPRHIQEPDRWLGVDSEMQEERDTLPIRQNARLEIKQLHKYTTDWDIANNEHSQGLSFSIRFIE